MLAVGLTLASRPSNMWARFWSRTGMRRMVTRSAWYPESAADRSALTALATRLTWIHKEGRTGRCLGVLTDER
jgi:hypothetical protein